MNRKLSTFIGIAILAFIAIPVQNVSAQNEAIQISRILTGLDSIRVKDSKTSSGIVSQVLQDDDLPSINQTLATMKRKQSGADAVRIYGNLIHSAEWKGMPQKPYGIYSFNATNDYVMTQEHIDPMMNANGGGIVYNGKMHFIRFSGYGSTMTANYYEYETSRWAQLEMKRVEDNSLLATDLTYDIPTNTVYGCFYKPSFAGFDFCSIDYYTFEKTIISSLDSVHFIGLASNPDGELYGISLGGNLYKVDKSNGKLTLIGSTGVVPGQYVQSATFDPNTGKLYWAALLKDKTAHLYEVSTTDGSLTEVVNFQKTEELAALYIPKRLAKDKAPQAVERIEASFPQAQHHGTIKFTLPTVAVDGSSLSGMLTYSIKVNGSEIKTGSALVGAEVAEQIDLTDGMKRLCVTIKNEKGTSDETAIDIWIGYDKPEKVSNLYFMLDETDNRATLTWNAPSKGLHNGYIGSAESIRYKLYRFPGGKLVADSLSGTTFSELLPKETYTSYYYSVVPFNSLFAGKAGYSDTISVGSGMNVPYLETFENESTLSSFVILDSNGDNTTWILKSANKEARYNYSDTQSADDWLLTPPIKLKAGYIYNFSFKYKAGFWNYHEKLAVAFGTGDNPSSYSELMPVTKFSTDSYTTFRKQITIKQDGTYRFGFHALSDAGQYKICVDSIAIDVYVALAAPASVKQFKAVAGAMGTLSATLSFSAPTKRIDGNGLSDITKIEVYRNDSILVKTFDNVTPGQAFSFTDTDVENGMNVYTVYAYNSYGRGEPATTQVYVGVDTPAAPKDIVLKKNGEGILLTWKSPGSIGSNGGYVDEKELTYTVYNIKGKVVAEHLTSTSYSDKDIVLEGGQSVLYYKVSATYKNKQSAMGKSQYLVAGDPYKLKFHESFAPDYPTGYFWWNESENGNDFIFSTKYSIDNKIGCAMWQGRNNHEQASLNSGKISLKGAQKPVVKFAHVQEDEKDVRLKVLVMKEDGSTDTLKVFDYKETKKRQWKKETLSLEGYKDEEYILLKFLVESNDPRSTVIIDNVYVLDYLEHNLETVVYAPSKGSIGVDSRISVYVANIGRQTAAGYTVKLYVDDELYEADSDPFTLTEDLDMMRFFYYTPTLTSPDTVRLRAVVEYDKDMDVSDNMSETVKMSIKHPDLPRISDLEGKIVNGKSAELTWSAPVIPEITGATDTFDDYEAWLTGGFGRWTVIDGDGAPTFGIDNVIFENEGTPMAFIVFNPTQIGIDLDANPNFKPYSGQQYLACMSAISQYAVNKHNDDWLISPLLSGERQTISFYAKSLSDTYREAFNIAYSTSTTDTTQFVTLQTVGQADSEWTQYSVELPEGAKYFALHVVSKDAYALLIDDVKFDAAPLAITSYNIYRDRRKVGNSLTVNYIDPVVPAASQVYHVSVVYNTGESALSNGVELKPTTRVDGIPAEVTAPFTVYTIDGRLVLDKAPNLQSLHRGVYIVNGRTITVEK